MTSYLLVISLLLNGIAIFSIIIIYARQNRLLEVEKAQEQMVKDMEEMISSYLLEMKEENEKFIEQFQQVSTQPPAKKIRTNGQQSENQSLQATAKNAVENGENKWTGKVGNAFKKQAVKAYKNAAANNEENSPIPSPNIMEDSHLTAGNNHPENVQERSQMTHEDIYRDLFVGQVKHLQKQGLSIDEIAKKMNRGKTEIELLLKFSENHAQRLDC